MTDQPDPDYVYANRDELATLKHAHRAVTQGGRDEGWGTEESLVVCASCCDGAYVVAYPCTVYQLAERLQLVTAAIDSIDFGQPETAALLRRAARGEKLYVLPPGRFGHLLEPGELGAELRSLCRITDSSWQPATVDVEACPICLRAQARESR
jgi:hypothetical protein